jgi:hypothetical protein
MIIYQAPNKPLLIALGAAGVACIVPSAWASAVWAVTLVAFGVWSLMEIRTGVNWFRKLFGGVVLVLVCIFFALSFG